MKIVNKTKFIRTISILIVIIGALIIFSKNTYSKVETSYKEDYVFSGDTLWSIAVENITPEYAGIEEYIQEIRSLNHLSDDGIHAGRYLMIREMHLASISLAHLTKCFI